MKRRFLFISFLCFAFISLSAQNSFKGEVIYKIDYEGEAVTEQVLSILPDQISMVIKGYKSRVSMKTPMGDQVTIINAAKKTVVNLLDIMGRKFAIQQTPDEIKLNQNRYVDLNVEFTNETLEIAGYTGKKAIVHVNHTDFDGQASFVVYYSEELEAYGLNFSDPLFHKIKPFLLQFETEARGLLMRFTAISVEEKKISEDHFKIPKEYKLTTKEEMKKSLGGF